MANNFRFKLLYVFHMDEICLECVFIGNSKIHYFDTKYFTTQSDCNEESVSEIASIQVFWRIVVMHISSPTLNPCK